MTRFWIALVAGFILTSVMGGLAAMRHNASSPDPGRHLIVPSGPINMGFVAPESRTGINFTVLDGGTKPLKIFRVMANCGCTVAKVDRAELRPGQAATVHVVFRSRGFWRGVAKRVYIISNDTQEPLQSVLLVGYVRIGTRLDANTMNLGSGKFRAVLGPKPIHIFADAGLKEGSARMTGDDAGLTMLAGDWRSVDGGEAQRCTLRIGTLPLTQLPGTYSRKVFITSGNRRLPLRVEYLVKPVVSCKPAEAICGPNKNTPAVLRLSFAGKRVHVESVRSSFGFCVAKLRDVNRVGAELFVAPSTERKTSGQDGLDIIHVRYSFNRDIRKETLDIPVVFVR